MDIRNLTGREKTAILLITLGREKAANIFKHLKDEEVESIVLEIANTQRVTPDTRDSVLEEFYQICLAQQYISQGGIDFAKDILIKALGEERAYSVLSKLTVNLQVRHFDFLAKIDANQIVNFISSEGAWTIALVLSYLRPQQAADVLSNLPTEVQADVARRIATMEGTTPDVIKDVERLLEKKVSSLATGDFAQAGGLDTLVEILGRVDRTTERQVLETLDTDDAYLAEEIRKKMFTFEDIIKLQPAHIQVLMGSVQQSDLVVALKSASEEIKALFLRNVSARRRADIEQELEYLGPTKKSDVEAAQQVIVALVRRLQQDKKIEIVGNSDEFV
ncbi:MAG: flagellar motor switch protein FliG [Defluviitaleaceae bacterium]|nr:flagellar motor switch protein FliG [Defluviitaleaceae bacterium]